VKRLIALLAGGLGLRAILRRRARRPAPAPSPADELKAKLAATKPPEPEPEPEPEPAPAPEGVDERRADVHARAREAIEELRDHGE
jgi:broad specificity phosphatase PhoE